MDNAKWFTTDVNNIDPYLVTISEIENKFGFYFTGIINEQQYKKQTVSWPIPKRKWQI